ncbi:PSP1-domain-containing protein [Gymnopus androsaceus JB14]|uniref:PSP1-domain-containing protein n=1 Tax=Gymnopus androsaceus JB14 TaxID=1447944 RepID=A0A6A4GRF4_9AGAR|nr:PSP1-domain-containing protein [Gymnopus androsaceus JB14]
MGYAQAQGQGQGQGHHPLHQPYPNQQHQSQHQHQHPHQHQHQHSHSQPHQSQPPHPHPSAPEQTLGRGVPLSAVPPTWKLYIVEFKAGRTDLFYLTDAVRADIVRNEGGAVNGNGHASADAGAGTEGDDSSAAASSSYPLKVGDLVIVEADRGRDLGRVVNDNITVEEVEAWLDAGRIYAGISIPPPGASGLGLGGATNPPSGAGANATGAPNKKEINPKQIYAKAGPAEASVLAAKMSDELKALQLCQSKVRVKKLPMEVVDAEYQWDRRKLTFYFVADKRIDFRELVRELFRLYKTRIWMASLQGGGGFEQ